MSIKNYRNRTGVEDIPLENIEIVAKVDAIDNAATTHVLSLYPDVSEGTLRYMLELSKRCFKAGIAWYKFPGDLSIRAIALTCIPRIKGEYDPEDFEFALLAITAAVDWYVKRGSELCR